MQGPDPGAVQRPSTSSAEPESHRVSAIAIIAAFNEEDIIEEVVSDLVSQGIGVYLIDDGSTDGTADVIEPFLGRGVIEIERRRNIDVEWGADRFEWSRILRRKQALASELHAQWFIHHDADEFRESPWPQLTLLEAISKADQLGFNAIDFECLNFLPTEEEIEPGRVRSTLTTYVPAAVHDRVQVRCWKRPEGPVDLESSGGHEASFPNRRVFPIRFLLRHYPLRSRAHRDRKVFNERRPRYLVEERERGWHVQYDSIRPADPLIPDHTLVRTYDPDAVRLNLMVRHRGFEALEEEIKTTRGSCNALQIEVERVAELLRDARSDKRTLEVELEAARTHWTTLEQKYAAKEKELQIITQGHRILTDQLAALTLRADDLRRERDRQEEQIGQLRVACSSAVGQMTAFRHSLSWRCTAPLRALYRMLTGAPKEQYRT